jgi:predicted ABC-type ATPase
VSDEDNRPILLVIAGPNGSGKTTLTTRLRELGLDFGEYINADEIALTMPPSADRDRLAQLEADRRRRVCLDERRSFSFETVMSHPSKIDEMREAKALGFKFVFYFIAVSDPQINLKRVQHRVLNGGHDVPPDRVVARYYRTMALMPQAILLADNTFVFDNSDVMTGPRIIFEFRNAKNMTTVYPKLGNKKHSLNNVYFRTLPSWVGEYVFKGIKAEAAKLGIETDLA